MRIAVHPGLYDPDTEIPSLLGTRCTACGGVFFPPLGIGCEICGAEANALQLEPMAADGVLHSVAIVHLHPGRGIEAPFGIGEIQLDAGPLIRATLAELLDVSAIGTRMHAGWATVGTGVDGNELVEPRFVSNTAPVVPETGDSTTSNGGVVR